MRVALLSPCFWPEVRRGGERFVRSLADGLIERGHEPRLITSHPGPPASTVEHGLPITRNWRPPAGRLRRRGFEDHLTHLPASYLSLMRGDDDAAVAVYPTDAVVAARWSRRSGRPAVYSCLGAPDRPYLASRRLRVQVTVEAARGCSAVTTLSAAAAAALRRSLGVESRVIPPGIDTIRFTPGGERAPEPTIVCAAAAADPMKRVALLLEAFALVRRERPAARLLLDRPGDPRLAGRLSSQDGVELFGASSSTALAEAYRAAWVSALPSVGEAFGLVLGEALACGTPGVGSRSGGIPEVLDSDAVGRLFEPEDPHDLARALLEGLELAADPGTRQACRDRAELLAVGRCAERYEELLGELGAGEGAGRAPASRRHQGARA